MLDLTGQLTMHFSDKLVKHMKEASFHTWDVPYLNQYEGHYVFVYGTLKRGGTRHGLISNVKQNVFAGVGVTERDDLDLWVALTPQVKDRFPIAIDSGDRSRKAKVKGELFYVSTGTIMKMDRVEQNGSVFDRTVTNIMVGTEVVPAFMYLGDKTFWRTRQSLNSPLLKQNGKNYHFYHQAMASNLKAVA